MARVRSGCRQDDRAATLLDNPWGPRSTGRGTLGLFAVAGLAVCAITLVGCSNDKSANPAAAASASPGLVAPASTAPPGLTPTASETPGIGPTPPPGQDVAAPVAPADVPTKPAVPLTAQADFGGGVSARITGSQVVTSQGQGPGELNGAPAVAFTVQLINRSARGVGLDGVTVAAFYGAQATPASPSGGPPTAPFAGSLPAGGTATGTYTYVVPPEGRGDVQLQISYLAGQPVVVLRGAVR